MRLTKTQRELRDILVDRKIVLFLFFQLILSVSPGHWVHLIRSMYSVMSLSLNAIMGAVPESLIVALGIGCLAPSPVNQHRRSHRRKTNCTSFSLLSS